jgi:hypothetical protein
MNPSLSKIMESKGGIYGEWVESITLKYKILIHL